MTAAPESFILITPGFASDESDSTCIPLLQSLVKAIQKQKPSLHIEIIALHYPFRKKQYHWQGARVHALHGKKRGRLFRFILYREMNRILDSISSQSRITGILSCWCGEAALLAKRYAGKKQIRHFCWILGQDAKKENRFVHRIKPAANELLALSDFIQQRFEKNHGIRPAQVLVPGIDPDDFNACRTGRVFDLMAAGSLIPLKQFHLIPEIVSALKRDFPHIRALLCGSGPEQKRIEKEIERRGLQDNLILTGEIPHRDLLCFMQQSKIFLHPSSYEGFGMVMPEALYAGCRVISLVKPLQKAITGWETVSSAEEMINRSAALLNDTGIKYESTLPFPISDTANALLRLFSA